jgi:outer membrane protein
MKRGMRMRIVKGTFVATFFFFCFFLMPSYAAGDAKIGVVDFEKIVDVSDAGKLIKKQGKKMAADLKKKEEEIKEFQERFKKEALVSTQEMRGEKEREFRIKVNDFKELQKKYRAEMQELQGRLLPRLRKEIFGIVQEIGKDQGYLLIIESGPVIYSPTANDITDRVIQKHKAKFAGASNQDVGAKKKK